MKNNKKLALYILEHFDVVGVLDVEGVLTVKVSSLINVRYIMLHLVEKGFDQFMVDQIEFTNK